MSVLPRFCTRFGSVISVTGFAASFILGLSAAQAATPDTIIMSTAPTQSIKRTHELYGPLAEYLTQATGKNVKLVPAGNFLEYNNRMRRGEYDILFDGPHYVGWRMKKLGDKPVARLPGKLVFAAVVKDGGTITEAKQLIGKKICAVNSPNLATLSITAQFNNPVRQPVIVSARSFKDAFACLKAGKGLAAILPVKFWDKFKKKGKTKGLRILETTAKRPLPPRTFTVSKRIDDQTRDRITSALLDSKGKPGPKPLLDRFRSENFVAATPREYKGLEGLLRSVWGFHN